MVYNGFFENEMQRETEQFGQIAQVFSSYECFHSLDDEAAFMRGINSIQLMYTGKRILDKYLIDFKRFNLLDYLPSVGDPRGV